MTLDDDLHDTEVFADELQARGDPRGELLTLELAAERATTSDEARRLHREAQRIRDAHESLVWPEPLRDSHVDMRSGFVVRANCEELFAAHVPSELSLSVRDLWTWQRRIDDLMPTLVRARARGLALDSLRQSTRDESKSTNLAGLRALAAVPGRWPAIRTLQLGGALEHIDGIASLRGLERLSLDASISPAQLRDLGKLELKALHIRTERIEPALIDLCGPTVERLELRGCRDSLAPLRELPQLRSLTLADDPSARTLASLAQLSQLEVLTIPTLDDPRTLDILRALRLQCLHVHTVTAELLAALASLTNVESLGYSEIVGEHVDLTPMLARPRLEWLAISTSMRSELVLPTSVTGLMISNVTEPLTIVGTPTELHVFDCDPRCVPASLLLNVRRLTVQWEEGPSPDLLTELPRACPNLEHLELSFGLDWQWPEAPRVLAGLPHLRRLSLGHEPLGAVAERARAFPELNVNDTHSWPRSGGEASRISIGGTPSSSADERDSPFAALLGWADELRSVKDRRAELLGLELSAELVDDPREARASNREANRIRAEVRAGLLDQLGQARALVRGGMPIHSDASWIRTGAPDDALVWLRSVEIDQEYAPIPLFTLGHARRLGMRLQRLSLGPGAPRRAGHDDQYTSCGLTDALIELRQLDALELHRSIFREQLAQVPALGLRHLTLCVENYEPAFINRFAATLESLTLTTTEERGMLDGLELPRLTTLELGRGWDPGWALARRDLRSLTFSLEDDEPPTLDWPQLEALGLALHGFDASDLVRQLPSRVPKLARLQLQLDNSRSVPLALDCAAMPVLTELSLEYPSPSALELTLPHPLARLRVSGFETVAVNGECDRLEASAATLTQLTSELCERVQQLMVLGDAPPDRSTLERFPALEYLSISDQTPTLETWLRELDAVPRLRTLVVRGLPLDRVARLIELRPELAIHVVEPGWRDPDRWPLPPE